MNERADDASDWVSLLANPEPVRAIFGAHVPSLVGVEAHEVLLGRDGPSLLVRVDLPDYPATPPRKWADAKANCVQLRLRAIGLRELKMNGVGWATTTLLTIESEGGALRLRLTGADLQLDVLADWVYVDALSAYLNGERRV